LKISILVKISAILVLLGYAWQHLFFDVLYPILLWDEGLLQSLAPLFGVSWSDWTDRIFSYDHIT
jgi:hypothetical protein